MNRSLWQSLEKSALLGSRRQPLGPLAAEPPLTELLARAPDDDAGALLHAVAVLDAYRRAGRQRPSAPGEIAGDLPTPSPSETLPACGVFVEAALKRLFEEPRRPLLRELLEQLAAAGRRLPYGLLPTALGLAVTQPELLPALAPVLGERGRWLAQFKPDWKAFASPDEPDANWEERAAAWPLQTTRVRAAVLNGLRRADPARALRLLQQHWPQEDAERRRVLLGCLDQGLNETDQTFLQQCLDDRSERVRYQAARQLARLGDAELEAAATAVLTTALRVDGKALRIDFPTGFDPGWNRFGIKQRGGGGRGGGGQKAGWLAQWLRLTRPSRLAADLGLEPSRLCAAVTAGDAGDWLFEALDDAAVDTADTGYIEARVDSCADAGRCRELLQRFAATLPAERRESLLTRALDRSGGKLLRRRAALVTQLPVLAELLRACRPLSAALSRRLLQRELPALLDQRHGREQAAAEIGELLAVELFAEAERALGKLSDNGSSNAAALLAAYRFRHQCYQELRHG